MTEYVAVKFNVTQKEHDLLPHDWVIVLVSDLLEVGRTDPERFR